MSVQDLAHAELADVALTALRGLSVAIERPEHQLDRDDRNLGGVQDVVASEPRAFPQERPPGSSQYSAFGRLHGTAAAMVRRIGSCPVPTSHGQVVASHAMVRHIRPSLAEHSWRYIRTVWTWAS